MTTPYTSSLAPHTYSTASVSHPISLSYANRMCVNSLNLIRTPAITLSVVPKMFGYKLLLHKQLASDYQIMQLKVLLLHNVIYFVTGTWSDWKTECTLCMFGKLNNFKPYWKEALVLLPPQTFARSYNFYTVYEGWIYGLSVECAFPGE